MGEKKNAFREIEHTADLGMEVQGADSAELFSAAANGLYRLIADPSLIEPKEEIAVSASAEGWEELLHAWLCELLAQFNLKGFVGRECEIKTLDAGRVEARLKGESLDLKRHRFFTEIKGVTYHELKVWQENGRWYARVIFDV